MAKPRPAQPSRRTPGGTPAAPPPQRLGAPALIGWAVIALLGLYALFLSGYWLFSLTAPGMVASDVLFVLGVLCGCVACVTLILAVPVFSRWRPPPRVLFPLAVVLGVFGLFAFAAVLPLGILWACDTVCRPVNTFAALPMTFACGALAAIGPGVMALNRNDVRWNAITVVFGVLGFAVAMFLWVEWGIYPSS